MSLQDGVFSEDAEEDLLLFLKSDKRKRVLVFPPVNNYRRFLIHQLVQDRFGDLLQTFSIGQGFARRTVVCYKSDYIGPPQVNGVTSQTSDSDTGKSSSTMGIESQCTPTPSPEHGAHKPRQVKSTPAYQIYRPPAARRARLEKSPAGPAPVEQTASDASARANRQKRPDRAVYVPRHRRSAPEVDVPGQESPPQAKPPKETLRTSPKAPLDKVTLDELSPPKEAPTTGTDSTLDTMEEQSPREDSSPTLDTMEEQSPREDSSPTLDSSMETPDQAIHTETVSSDSTLERMEDDASVKSDEAPEPTDETAPTSLPSKTDESSDKRDRRKTIETAAAALESAHQRRDEEIRNKRNDTAFLSPPVLIITSAAKEEASTKPAQAAPLTPPEKRVKKVERPKSKPAPPPQPASKVNRDECDWDSLFDDNGDCLDPSLIDELTSSVGEVVIEKPKSSYKSFTRPVEVSSDEYGHVLEIYNFPSEFKSSDIAAVFSNFKSGGFELKWVDDTHCLGVFSSPLVAAEVLAADHPFVKTRPLSEATTLSKTKARKSSEFLQPYRTRPETCAALARRLVTKSLGVKLATARQEREQEKIVLREAKEKRRLANKQREDVWEGIIADKPTT